jgi:hypothetical protein
VFGGRRFTTSSDVWSFAMLMIEVFTDGAEPFFGTPQSEVLAAMMAGTRPKQPLLCSDMMFKVLTQCWSADTQQRPSFEILEQQFEGLAKKMPRESAGEHEADREANVDGGDDGYQHPQKLDPAKVTLAKVDGGNEGYQYPKGFEHANGKVRNAWTTLAKAKVSVGDEEHEFPEESLIVPRSESITDFV